MSPTLIAIETTGRSGRGRRLVFDDGTDRVTPAAVVRELSLEPGVVVSIDELAADLDLAERSKARERALRLLTQREHSTSELAARLRDDGYPAGVAREIVDALASSGIVDDARFADAWARARSRQGYGRNRIASELHEKGVEPEVASAALAEACPDDEIVRARALLRGHVPTGRKERDRALRRLIGRGFPFAVALQAIEDDRDPDQEILDPADTP